MLEIRIDCYKLMNMYRRPIAVTANSIGTWMTIYVLVSIFAVVTNAGLLMFTVDLFPSWSAVSKVWGFYVIQVVLYTAMYAAQVVIPDTPVDVEIQLKRGKALISRIINRSPDEDYNSAQEITEELRSEGFLKGKNKLHF
eukprot:FR740645.1.p1 GENE.FR740645.1~~FR740645.1.p1  ORF type:complete len:140 (+),score=2.39 FR740645.1:269-688(+)